MLYTCTLVCLQGVAISEAGTSLSEMLQTETILDAHRHRTESTSSSSSVLTSLLQQGDTVAMAATTKPVCLSSSLTSMAQFTSPTLTQILQSDQVTSSTELALAVQRRQALSPDSSTTMSLVDILKQKDSAALPLLPPATNMMTTVSMSDTNITLTQILTGPNPIVQSASNKRVAEKLAAAETQSYVELDVKPDLSASTAFLLGEDTDIPLMEMDSAAADIDSLSQLLEDSSNFMFENGK